jgi:cobalt-precorrin 5A hydrolase / precorrin-3B C17-methyltransferase
VSTIVCCSVTAAGGEVARRLPYEHRAGRLIETTRALWAEVDALVVVGAVGMAVRAVAPLLGSKQDDPAVVCVDDAARFAVALVGGHAGGANALAREVAALLGAQPVVTTATEGAGLPALDDLPGLQASGDLAGVTRRWLDGMPPAVEVHPALEGWPLPAGLGDATGPVAGGGGGGDDGDDDVGGSSRGRIAVTDSDRRPERLEVLLRPPSIIVGVGASTGADPESLWEGVTAALAVAGVHISSVAEVATVDRKADEPAIIDLAARLGVRLRVFGAADLADVAVARRVPNPSPRVAAAVGTPSVAEAAALLAGGPDAALVAAKHVTAAGDSTVALARRRRPPGSLAVVGLGPGDPALRTPAATRAIRHADTVIGYGPYVDLAGDVLRPHQTVLRTPIGTETDRCRHALARAVSGQRVALVCSGDPGVYALASLVFELAPAGVHPSISVVPGVTAALSAAAVLGAPLGHDHAAISLSDLLTPWDLIVRRLQAAAAGDFVVSLYNPRSPRRSTQLGEALVILGGHRPGSTPAAVLTDVGRSTARVVRTTLAELDPAQAGMRSLVVVGATSTRWIGDHMVTPRGYRGIR